MALGSIQAKVTLVRKKNFHQRIIYEKSIEENKIKDNMKYADIYPWRKEILILYNGTATRRQQRDNYN